VNRAIGIAMMRLVYFRESALNSGFFFSSWYGSCVGRRGGGGAGGGAKEGGNRGPGFEDTLGRIFDTPSDLGGEEVPEVFWIGSTAETPLPAGTEEGPPLLIGAASSGADF
jgi:hypothetical protein